jgi:HSP20 family protein
MMYSVPQTTWFKPVPTYGVNYGFFSPLDKEFDEIFNEFGRSPTDIAARSPAPRMSVAETDSWVEIEAELPGVEDKDVEVTLSDDVLTIKGEKRIVRGDAKKDYYYQERTFGKFARSITLPFQPDPKSVKTLFVNGVLKITLPRSTNVNHHTVRIPLH